MINGLHAATLRRLSEAFMNPLTWVFVLLAIMAVYLLCHGRNKTAKRLGGVGLMLWLVLYVVSTPWLPNWMTKQLERQYPRVQTVDASIHWVVVLGGGVTENLAIPAYEALGSASLKRMLEGVRLYRELPHAKMILSGRGTAKAGYTNAERFAEFSDWLHIPAAHRVLEADSINTKDEARLIQPMVKDKPFYLVTSATHMPRSMALFEQYGMHPVAAPCQFIVVGHERPFSWQALVPNASNLLRFNVVWHEYLGQLLV